MDQEEKSLARYKPKVTRKTVALNDAKDNKCSSMG